MPPRARKAAPAKKVDETVQNQENPGTSTEDRTPEESGKTTSAIDNAAPAQEVDDTVKNQESLGSAEVVDRNPEPQLVEDPFTGGLYDVSKADRELVDPGADEREAEKNRIRQTEAVLDAKEIEGADDEDKEETPKIKVEFLESGLTVGSKVYKKGEVLEIEDTEAGRSDHVDADGNYWYDQSAGKQKERFGKVVFEKR
jgi:hypothetical protein